MNRAIAIACGSVWLGVQAASAQGISVSPTYYVIPTFNGNGLIFASPIEYVPASAMVDPSQPYISALEAYPFNLHYKAMKPTDTGLLSVAYVPGFYCDPHVVSPNAPICSSLPYSANSVFLTNPTTGRPRPIDGAEIEANFNYPDKRKEFIQFYNASYGTGTWLLDKTPVRVGVPYINPEGMNGVLSDANSIGDGIAFKAPSLSSDGGTKYFFDYSSVDADPQDTGNVQTWQGVLFPVVVENTTVTAHYGLSWGWSKYAALEGSNFETQVSAVACSPKLQCASQIGGELFWGPAGNFPIYSSYFYVTSNQFNPKVGVNFDWADVVLNTGPKLPGQVGLVQTTTFTTFIATQGLSNSYGINYTIPILTFDITKNGDGQCVTLMGAGSADYKKKFCASANETVKKSVVGKFCFVKIAGNPIAYRYLLVFEGFVPISPSGIAQRGANDCPASL